MNKIAVLGGGVMARGIAQVFAEKGYETTIWVISLEKESQEYIIGSIEKSLKRAVSKKTISEGDMKNTLKKIRVTEHLDDLSDSDLIVEAIVEDIDLKKHVFKKLDELCKDNTIIATNTSSLSITEISSATHRPDRVIGMHFFNPAPVMKLVEIIRGMATSQETFDFVKGLSLAIGKEPVEVAEAPGFVVNRILIPMINEASFILQEGIASVEDIDTAMKFGANHPMGPLALGDLIGLDVCLAIMDVLYNETGDNKYRASSTLRKYVRAGWLGRKTGRGFYNYKA